MKSVTQSEENQKKSDGKERRRRAREICNRARFQAVPCTERALPFFIYKQNLYVEHKRCGFVYIPWFIGYYGFNRRQLRPYIVGIFCMIFFRDCKVRGSIYFSFKSIMFALF